ncbi:hypothetical protein [Flavobacterium sp.]|uniref:hypothetical protein n=1 Tax=Flavobacterium sp. TaxID=239 RepID=UPI003D0E991B
MKKNLKIFLLLCVSVLVSNCAFFSKKDFKNDYTTINESNILSFNGKYTFFPVKKFDSKNKNADFDLSGNYINSYNNITNESLKFEDRDSILKGTTIYHIELNLVDNTALNIELFKNNYSIKKQQIKGILKKDGMFYLDNKFLKCTGIPYLFGGCNNNKRRIAISKNNNLIVNEAVDNTGALLFLLWGGLSYNSAYEFKRLQ